MAIDVRWLEPRILLFKIQPPFTTKELSRALDESIEMVNALTNQPIGTVLDVKGIRFVAPGMLQQGAKLSKVKRENVGPVVMIRAHPFLMGAVKVARTLHPPVESMLYFADDRASGVELLRQALNLQQQA